MSSSSCENSESNPERMVSLGQRFRDSIPAAPYAHTRVDSGEIAGAGEQFRPPGPQTSWPRHVEIAPEDLEFQNMTAGDLAAEMPTTPRQRPRRISRGRGGSQAFSCPSMPQGYSSEEVALLVTQRDKAQVKATQSDRSSVHSSKSVTDGSDTYGSSTLTSKDDEDESASAHTPTQDNTVTLNASRPSTPEPRSYTSTEDGHGHPEQDLVFSSPPWSTQKRKRVDSSDGGYNE